MGERLTPDLCVIGAGAGGLTVAAAAAAFDVPVVLIERGEMGGDCLNAGCVPSKALIAAAKQVAAIRKAAAFGITAPDPQVDFAGVMAHVRAVQAAIAPHDSEARFTGLGVRVIRAAARFVDPQTVVAGEVEIRARRFVIATGSQAAVPPIPGLADVAYLTNATLWKLTELPRHLLVLGAGPIGLEMAQAFRRLGAAVSVLEIARPLAKDDPEAAALVVAQLVADGVDIRSGIDIRGVRSVDADIAIDIVAQGRAETITGSHLLVAAGRRPVIDGLDLDAARIDATATGIRVDDRLRTSNGRVYAVGDVIGGPMFSHMAGWQGSQVVRNALFRLPIRARDAIPPRVTFCDPELAQVGLTEQEARTRHGAAVRVVRWPFQDNDRAQTERTTAGWIKVIADRRGRILGATIIGAQAGEIANQWALALAGQLTLRAVAGVIAPYPTLSDISKRAAVSFFSPTLTSPLVKTIIRMLRRLG